MASDPVSVRSSVIVAQKPLAERHFGQELLHLLPRLIDGQVGAGLHQSLRVCGIVKSGPTPAVVPDAVIADIRRRERDGAIELRRLRVGISGADPQRSAATLACAPA